MTKIEGAMVVDLDVGLAFEYSGSQSNEVHKFIGAQSFAPLPSTSRLLGNAINGFKSVTSSIAEFCILNSEF